MNYKLITKIHPAQPPKNPSQEINMNFWYTELTNKINYTAYLQNKESLKTQNQLYQSALPLLTKRFVIKSTPPPSPVALRANAGNGLLINEVSRSHTMTQHSR